MSFSQAQSRGRLLRFLSDNLEFEENLSITGSLYIESALPSVRLYDSDATDTQGVQAYTGYYQGDDDNRVGFVGYGSTLNENLLVYNQTPTGSIDLYTNATARMLIQHTGSVRINEPEMTNGDATFGTLILGRKTGYPSIVAATAEHMIIDSTDQHLALNYFSGDNIRMCNGGGDVGIGSGVDPAYKLDVGGDLNIADGSYIRIGGTAVASVAGNTVTVGSTDDYKDLSLYCDAGVALKIDSAGSISQTLQAAVYAARSATQDLNPDTDWETVIFNADATAEGTAFDVGADYNVSTGVFTAPADGKYLISTEVMLTNIPLTAGYIMLQLITTKSVNEPPGGLDQYSGRQNPNTFATEPDYQQIAGTWLAAMDSGDTAYVQVKASAGDSDTKIYGSTDRSYTRIQIIKVA